MPVFTGKEAYADASMAELLDGIVVLNRWTPSGLSHGYTKRPCNINARGILVREDPLLKIFVP